MKILSRIVLAALLLGASAPARAAARPEENRRYAYADAALDALSKKITDIKSCISEVASLKAEIATKKAELAAENNGVVPSAYDDAFTIKQARISRVRTACFTLNKDLQAMFTDAHIRIRGIEPPSASGVPKRRERLASLQVLANSVVKNLR